MKSRLSKIRSLAMKISFIVIAFLVTSLSLQKAQGIEPDTSLSIVTEIFFGIAGLLILSYLIEIFIYAFTKKQ